MINKHDTNRIVLLIIDMINDFDFIDGDKLFIKSLPIAKNILLLKNEFQKNDFPVIYVNDNFGKWKSNFNILIDHCINDNTLGKDIVQMLRPDKEDYFVLKPKHSAFYSTTLELLLKYLEIDRLFITGIKTDSCILSTAIDAYMRDYKITIPKDCITTTNINEKAIIDTMKESFNISIVNSKEITF